MSNLVFIETGNRWYYYSLNEIFIQLLYALFLIRLFQYSDRFTPILLIVSLAGIKVCSPDGKVSIKDAHVVTVAKKKRNFALLRGYCYRKTGLTVPTAFSKTKFRIKALSEKFASSSNRHDCILLHYIALLSDIKAKLK